jgi:hypothetical protein
MKVSRDAGQSVFIGVSWSFWRKSNNCDMRNVDANVGNYKPAVMSGKSIKP